jgi:branched-chain amino acid transport system ATP-binding protein
LSVRENLLISVPPWRKGASFDRALEAFPVLAKRRTQIAGTLSGGEQQMLALARAYLADPKIVLLDEVSMGLAPIVVDEIFESLKALAETGVALLLVEQYVNRALALADHVYLISRGEITFHGPSAGLDEDELASRYFGLQT